MISLKIEDLRKEIDIIDAEILSILSKRKTLVNQIAALKKSMKLPVLDAEREKYVLDNLKKKAKENGLNTELIDSIYNIIFENSRLEQEIQNSNPKCKIKEIGLIGFGRFGKLAAKYLSEDFRIYVANKNKKLIGQKNIIPSNLKEVCKKDIVILAVPISEFENTLKNVKKLVKKNTLVIDVCSVKEYTVNLMEKILPNQMQILATHPLFGPDSASESLVGRKIVLCKTRVNDDLYSQTKLFLKSKGLIVIEATAEEHDLQMAKSLVLTHLIGRALIEMKAKNLNIDTRGYQALIKILDTVKNDSLQFFEDINHYNRFSEKVRKDLIESILNVDKRLKK